MQNQLKKIAYTYDIITRYKILIKEAVYYSFGTIVIRIIGLAVAPFAVLRLSPQEYGIISYITTFIGLSTVLISGSLRNTLALEFKLTSPLKIINSLLITYFLSCIPYCVLLLYLQYPLRQFLHIDSYHSLLFACIVATIVITFFADMTIVFFQQMHRVTQLTLLQISSALLAAIIKICCLLGNLGIISQIVSNFIAIAPIAGYGCYIWIKHCVYKDLFKNFLYYFKSSYAIIARSIVHVPLLLSPWVIGMSDRYFLAHYGDLELVGLYSFADLFGQLTYFLLYFVFQGAYLPFLISKYKENKNNSLHLAAIEKENLFTMQVIALAIALLLIIGLIPGIPLLYRILPNSYSKAIPFIVILCFAQIIQATSYFSSALIFFLNKQKILPLAFLGSFFINLLIHKAVTAHWPFFGGLLAPLITFGSYSYFVFFINKKIAKTLH